MAGKDPDAAATWLHRNDRRMTEVRTLTYSDDPHPCLLMNVSGLAPSDFDRDCKPIVKSIMRIDGGIRSFGLCFVMKDGFTSFKLDENGKLVGVSSQPLKLSNGGKKDVVFLDWIEMSDGLFGFGAWAVFTFTRDLYDPKVPKWNLEYRFELGHVANCGLTGIADAYSVGCEEENGESKKFKKLLWSNQYGIVMVSKKTRQPAKFPSWFKEKYEGTGCIEKPLVLRPFNKPGVTFQQNFTVCWSDTDMYGHANWSSYVRWAEDGLRAAMLPKNQYTRGAGGALSGLTEGHLTRGLEKLQITYFRECLEGEKVEVHLWQERGGPPELVWCIVIKNKEEINQCKLWYIKEKSQGE